MREGWKTIPFESSIQKVKYTTKIPSSEYLPQGLFPIVSQEEGLISGYWDNDADVFHHNKPVVIFGDHTRIIKYVDFDFVLGADGVKILLPVEGLSAKFLSYYLRWYKVPSLGYSRHFKLLKEASVPLPSIAEQEKIVAELDCLTGIIEKKKQQLEELDNLAQSIFYDMFGDPITNEKGWEMKRLGEVGKVITGNTPTTRDAENYASNDYCFVKPGDIGKDAVEIIENTEAHISTKAYLASRKLPIGSVLTTCIGIVGKVGITKKEATCNQQINAILPNEGMSSTYVANAILLIRKVLETMANAPVVPIINKGEFSSVSIPFPPLDLQNAFAKKVEAIEKQKELVKRSIVETEMLFNSRMDFWFN